MHTFETPAPLLGIAGPRGAGKDTAGEYCEDRGLFHISLSTLIRELAAELHRPQDRQTLIDTAKEARERDGGDVFVRMALERWRKTREKPLGGLAISGHFTLKEATAIQELGGVMLWVDADDEIRTRREQSRGRVDAPESVDELRAQEKTEREGLGGPNTPNLDAVAALPGVVCITNNGSLGEFRAELDSVLDIVGGWH